MAGCRKRNKRIYSKSLVVTFSVLLPILLLTAHNNLLHLALFCQDVSQYTHFTNSRNSLQNMAFRGKTRRNKTMIKVLFICHGNICRSPMAEFVMKKLVSDAGLTARFQIASAATSTEEIWNGIGNPVYPPAKAELARHGISCEGKRARQVTRADYAEYDYLIGMDGANIRNMLRIFGGDPDGKVARLLSYVGSERDISDPWYTGDFEATYRDVLAGCKGLLECLKEEL